MTKRALLIGINRYPDARNNLNSCVADTVRFQGLLQNLYGFQPQDIAVLHDEAATLANARTGLNRLFSGIRPGDEVVFFQSSHGYRYTQGTTYTEVLCLYDAFLADTELVQLSGQAPPGTFTCVVDACHAAGLDKLFFAPNGLYAARAKVWQPPLDQATTDIAALANATSFKAFGRAATSDTGAVAKLFSPEAFGTDGAPAAKGGEGEPQLNGVLFSACRADETAAAGSPPTDDLSAFTWALGKEMEAGGSTVSANTLRTRVVNRLQALNMRQNPQIEAPMAHGGWLDQTLINYANPGGTAPTGGDGMDAFDAFLRSLGIGVNA